MKRLLFAIGALMLLCLSFGCGSSVTASDAEQPVLSESEEEPMSDTTYPVATITMESGDTITLELYPAIAPESVKNFIYLANDGFYDGLIFHRVIKGFMIQGGDPTGTGMGGPGYAIKGEFKLNGVSNTLSHKRGVISMARSKAYDSAGSQFFIVQQDSIFLDGQYAAFGRVTSGMSVVDAIAETKTDSSDRPIADQVIATIRVETFGVDYGEPEKLSE